MRVLVTRPEPDAARTAAALRAVGYAPLVVPLARVVPTGAMLLEGPDGFVVTSPNGARALVDALAARADVVHLPVYAVGARTGALLAEAGFEGVVVADGDLAALAKRLAGDPALVGKRLVWAAGEERAGDLAAMVGPAGPRIEVVALYRMAEETALPEVAARALRGGELDAVLHFSVLSFTRFADLVEAAGLGLRARTLAQHCLSPAVAEAAQARGYPVVMAASAPTEASLVESLALARP